MSLAIKFTNAVLIIAYKHFMKLNLSKSL